VPAYPSGARPMSIVIVPLLIGSLPLLAGLVIAAIASEH
jgi:hypothetical protein